MDVLEHRPLPQMYMHGGLSLTTGHGCINDLWTFDMASHRWEMVPCVGQRQSVSTKFASHQTVLSSSCYHALAVLRDGTCAIFGGFNGKKAPVRVLQAAVPLVEQASGNLLGGVPSGIFMHAADLILGQAHARCDVVLFCSECIIGKCSSQFWGNHMSLETTWSSTRAVSYIPCYAPDIRVEQQGI
jgi:hypothetical protein